VHELAAFYDEHYKTVGSWTLQPGHRIFLGDKENRRCRFCGKGKPAVSFRAEAHAIPECVGNKSLFTYHECDFCNQAFGQGCENDFENWSSPMRTMARICGKVGVPTIKHDPAGELRIDSHPDGLRISVDEAEGFLDNDPATKTLTFHLRRGPYRPAMVVKAMIKMALSVMPEEEMCNFQHALAFIKPDNSSLVLAAPTPFFHTFVSGGSARDRIVFAVMTRRRDDFIAPYAHVLLRYGNEMLQMAVPSAEKDSVLNGKNLTLKPYPCTSKEDSVGNSTDFLPYVSMDFVRDEEIIITMSYGEQRLV
jgi:HNH endonuclease